MAEEKRSFLEPAVLARLMALPLHARQTMLGSVSGKHRSPVKGSSLEFAQYRKYVPGDDTRRLDWRTWGRSDRFYIKEFEADTNLRLCLLLDTSGSMGFGPAGATRLDYARKLAGTLAYLAAQQGDAAGLWSMAEPAIEIPPKRGASHLGLVLDQMGTIQPLGGTTLLTALHNAAEKIRQRALIVILSDFFVPPVELKSAIQHLRFRRHDVAAFHLLDQQELDFDFDRPARFVDMEGGEMVLADPSLIARNYREAVRQYLMEMDELVRTTGMDYHRVKLHDRYEDVLARFLLGRTPKRGSR
ncbi:DUF58 domain-containing protein [Verrucomicrobium sp. BvORR034]|jgi:uncharacterized protein (DUF58 family)|uniref:DUF58 domain-containing protein n=1 Tax=Verrucomicrobium sp. BvORR034 TaxID=1396418 RepID=UPI000679C71B|nr:DUF58 domain-containing protein [Verrucomicrobium sp. BvORR034]